MICRAGGVTNPIAMRKKNYLLTVSAIVLFFSVNAQCLTAPPFPACTGTETLVLPNDNIGVGQTKYFYGSVADLSNVKLRGGTLVVCSDLTLTDFALDSGTLFIQPSATLIVNNGAGIVARGNTAVYNAGIFQCLGNYVMDGSYATPLKPNIFMNTSAASWLKMPNQYFVINNPYSSFINNGQADFHGLITDPGTAQGSVCLGFNSQTRMRFLYNKVKNPYIAPAGAACVSVTQYSQFYDTLTVYPNINFCLAPAHTSDASCIPWGCKPNAWGSGQVTTNCSSCSMVLTFLPVDIKKIEATANKNYNEVRWQTAENSNAKFYVQRSVDAVNFTTVDSVKGENKMQYAFKDYSFKNNSYYRITFRKGDKEINSAIAQVTRTDVFDKVYPNPFKNFLIVPMKSHGTKTISVKITDIYGREIIPANMVTSKEGLNLYFNKIAKGIYLITVINGKEKYSYKAMRE